MERLSSMFGDQKDAPLLQEMGVKNDCGLNWRQVFTIFVVFKKFKKISKIKIENHWFFRLCRNCCTLSISCFLFYSFSNHFWFSVYSCKH